MTSNRSPFQQRLSRRHAAKLAAGAAIGSSLLGWSPVTHTLAQSSPAASPIATGESELEIFSWWTTAGEAAGLEELFKAFSATNPNVKVVNAAVAGGAGSNAQVALQTRLSANQPPDSWQSHPGAELKARYVDPGYTVAIDDLYTEQKWENAFPKGVIDLITVEGKKQLVPVGVHRGNVMFYNKDLLSKNGITVTDAWTMDDFFKAADTLKAAGVPALAIGSKDTFAIGQLFENTLLAALGPDDYTKVWTGAFGWDDAKVTTAIENLAKYFGSVNSDHASLTWDGAADEVYAGKAAFTSMGDWLYGDATAKNKQDTIGWVNHPGTDGSFVAVIDGFTMPKGAPHPVNARNWLIAVGSKEAQAAFAPHKGAIPARSDADSSTFNDYMKWSAAAFGKDSVVPSLAHGSAASPQFQLDAYDALVSFIVDLDVKTLQQALVDAQANQAG